MGPIWGRHDPSGPHVGPMNFAIWNMLSNESCVCQAVPLLKILIYTNRNDYGTAINQPYRIPLFHLRAFHSMRCCSYWNQIKFNNIIDMIISNHWSSNRRQIDEQSKLKERVIQKGWTHDCFRQRILVCTYIKTGDIIWQEIIIIIQVYHIKKISFDMLVYYHTCSIKLS